MIEKHIVVIKLVVLLYICHVSSLFCLSVVKKREPKDEHYIIKYLHLELKLHDTAPLDRPTTHQKLYIYNNMQNHFGLEKFPPIGMLYYILLLINQHN